MQGKKSRENCLSSGGKMGSLMREKDWSITPVGPVDRWPQSLRTAVSIMLASGYPMYIAWGPEFVQFYNDAYRPILGSTKHPAALGQGTRECFAEIWHIIGSMFNNVMENGEATWREDQLLPLDRHGYLEECYFTFSYSAIRDESGGVGGVFVTCIETTQRVLGERRLRSLRELAAKTSDAKTVNDACFFTIEALKSNTADIPFAILYKLEETSSKIVLIGSTIDELPQSIFPYEMGLDNPLAGYWKFSQVAADGEFRLCHNLPQYAALPGGLWTEPAVQAVVLPVIPAGQQAIRLFLIVGLSPRRSFDDDYRGFLELVSKQVASAISNATAYEEEKKRAEMLAELDRAKTAFFSNVSHEFRTPLTLMLGPLEDLLADHTLAELPSTQQKLAIVHRNSLRLLKLVNTLLDFSRIEAGRIEAVFEETDIAAFSAELASSFRSLVESSGLQLYIDCPSVPESVYVDREMWEKIVLNLLSNAFKFTFDGAIRVSIKHFPGKILLEVSDTGTGIPEDQLTRVFERFHRIEGAKARTQEGSGIGLSLIQELVKIHSGNIGVESKIDEGTTFRIEMPTGKAHLPSSRIGASRTMVSTGVRSESYIEEAKLWLPDDLLEPQSVPMKVDEPPAHILLADDNADMRAYLKRLLENHWTVTAVADGRSALDVLRKEKVDLLLTDVMMPGLDGFELLREIRNDTALSKLPVILLSARAGEESKVEGLQAGADDYLIKPFASRELIAHVRSNLHIARLREEALARERASGQEMKKLLETVKASEERFQIVARATNDAVWDWNLIANTVWWNEAVTNLFGYAVEEVDPDASWWYLNIHEDDRERVVNGIHNLINSGNSFWRDEYRFKRRDGQYCFVLGRGYVIYDEQGLPVRIIGTMFDLTERKVAEQERTMRLTIEKEARKQAEIANRIKDEFLATLSHEVRTPLTAILGWVRMLRNHSLDQATTLLALETIERNLKVQEKLIGDLLDISRIMLGKVLLDVQNVDLLSTVHWVVEALRPQAEARGVTVARQFKTDSAIVAADSERLQQIVSNLLSNAIKFSPVGGTITVEVEGSESHVELRIKDQGIGIDPEFLPHVYDRFTQGAHYKKRSYGGLGLGLAIVRQLVELHDGAVHAHSDGVGKGAIFSFRLPLVDQKLTVPSGKVGMNYSGTPLKSVRILLVEDDADTKEMIAALLRFAGAIVTVAEGAREALEKLEREPFDLMISDIGMPEMDGLELIRVVRSQQTAYSAIPAIALTAYAKGGDRKHILTSGFHYYLSKPVEPGVLVSAIVQLIPKRSPKESLIQ